MAVIKNKDVLQSYILTTAKYDFNVYEKRILYRIIEVNQKLLDGLSLNKDYSIQKTVFGNSEYALPMGLFLKNGEKNNNRIKQAFKKLQEKKIEYEESNGDWGCIPIIGFPKFTDGGSIVKFVIDSKIQEPLLNFAKGYRKYELKTAMEFESVYAMRFYELLSNQKKPLTYSIENLKEMFGIADKYKLVGHFKVKVLDMAKKELDKCSPYTFDYEMNKTGRAFTSVTFYPIYQPQFRDSDLEKRELQKQLSPSWELPKNVLNYLKSNFEFDTKEIKQNIDLFALVNSKIDFIQFMANVKARANRAENPKGYLINALKKEINK